MNEFYQQALKLLQRRDYTVEQLRQRLEGKFGAIPDGTIELLLAKHFLDDRRFAENFVAKRRDRHPARVREELLQLGVAEAVVNEAIETKDWPSLREALKVKMDVLRLAAPLNRRDAARLFRALNRLGYPDDEIQEELEQLHEQ